MHTEKSRGSGMEKRLDMSEIAKSIILSHEFASL